MRRLRAGEWLAGAGGVAVIATVWAGPAVLAVLLALLAIPALALPVTQATRRSPAVPVALGVLTTTAALVALVLALVRLLDRPGAGAWIGLAGAVAALAGGWLSMRAEHTPGAVAPHVPRRPAPPPSA
jgi:uncharacterized membrane protein